jgi:YVTN family beta-propeller protein
VRAGDTKPRSRLAVVNRFLDRIEDHPLVRFLVLIGGLLAGAGLLVGMTVAVVHGLRGPNKPPKNGPSNGLPRYVITQSISLGKNLTDVVVGYGSIWISKDDGSVYRVSSDLRSVVSISVGAGAERLAVGDGAVWVANGSLSNTVSRIDPKTNEVRTFNVAAPAGPLAAAHNSLWVASGRDVWRIDPSTFKVLARIGTSPEAHSIVLGFGSVWVAVSDAYGADSAVLRINPKTNKQITRIATVNGFGEGIAISSGAVWVTNSLDTSVSRIDPATNKVSAVIPTQYLNPLDITGGEFGIWVADAPDVAKIDPETNQITARVAIGKGRLSLGVGQGALWVVSYPRGRLYRVGL